ncbi:hypothetical protein [Streptomyces sp. NPDC021212]|uniref:hypothetical protein n=1 Tax=Streptomyces sp. NPDC021212 TaxID=3365118 RepID=UPI003797EFCE
MSTLAYAVHDSRIMLRRNLKHAIRYPAVGFGSAMMPILMLLLFAYAFGGSIGVGMGGGGRDVYVNYLPPGYRGRCRWAVGGGRRSIGDLSMAAGTLELVGACHQRTRKESP